MRFYENESKSLLTRCSISVPAGRVAHSAAEAVATAVATGLPVALKGQVLSGGRMKAGAVRFAETEEETRAAAEAILALSVAGSSPAGLLVESKVDLAREYYLGVTYDALAKRALAIVSDRGGIDVEEVAAREPAHVVRRPFSALLPLSPFPFREAVAALGIAGGELASVADALYRLAQLLLAHDLTLAEINPLAALPDGSLVALDCHLEMEDEAVARQRPLLEELGIDAATRQARQPTPFERRAAEIDQMDHRGVAGRVIEFDGDLGLLIGGGGASLTAFDAVRRHGGRPANYCEIGGNPSVRKVAELTRHILTKPGVERLAVIMNVVNNTRVDLVARGVIKGCLEAGRQPAQAITVFRIPGAWEEEGFRLLRRYGIEPLGREVSIDEAARRAVFSGGESPVLGSGS
jgi:succinyl-CoA synthetase beta subunit/citryl-CoA synthetase large subunit